MGRWKQRVYKANKRQPVRTSAVNMNYVLLYKRSLSLHLICYYYYHLLLLLPSTTTTTIYYYYYHLLLLLPPTTTTTTTTTTITTNSISTCSSTSSSKVTKCAILHMIFTEIRISTITEYQHSNHKTSFNLVMHYFPETMSGVRVQLSPNTQLAPACEQQKKEQISHTILMLLTSSWKHFCFTIS